MSATTSPSDRPSGLGSRFWRLWGASSLSNLADGVQMAALPLLAVTLTTDPLLVSGVAVAAQLPWLLFSPFSGVIVDRFDRRAVMAGALAFRFAVVAILALLVGFGTPSPVLLTAIYVAALLFGMVETIFDNGAFAILPAVVPKDRLELANARLFASQTVTNGFAGPPLGSLAFKLGAALPFGGQALLLAVGSLLLWRLPGDYRPRHAAEGSWRTVLPDIAEGFRWYFGHRVIRALGVGIGVCNFALLMGHGVYVLYASQILGLDAAGYGLLLACGAVGGVLAGVAARPLIARVGGGTIILGGQLFQVPLLLALILFPHPVVAGTVAALGSFAAIAANVVMVTFRQSVIPDRLLGRVTSVFRLVAVGAGALGALAGGLVADVFGLLAPFAAAAAVLAANTLWLGFFVNNRSLATARADASAA